LAVEHQAKILQSLDDVAITETRKRAHQVAMING
jgi:hypothetical protein